MDWKGFEVLKSGVEERISEFDRIAKLRREELERLALGIRNGLKKNQTLDLIFICTHNSRRSQMGQIWAQLAALFYGEKNIRCYSGGTEVTAFHPRAVKVMKEEGFRFRTVIPGSNPVFKVEFPGARETDRIFSKKYTDQPNPTKGFIAVMTCADADEACPVVHGAALRFAIRYDDPKAFDGKPDEQEGYRERNRQIAREMFFLFSRVASTI